MQDRRTALVTGASAGIGAAFAAALARQGHDLILTARRAGRLERMAEDLTAAHGCRVTVLPEDLGAAGAAERLAAAIAERRLKVDWFVNNAGYGVPGAFDASGWETHAAFLRVMVEAPTELVWRLLPAMRERGYGRIVNVASLAGLVPGTAGHSLYPGAKAYLIKFSQSLAAENADRNVRVCALCPGFTFSEFHDVTRTRARMNKLPGFLWQSAEAVVAEGIAAVEVGRVVHVTGRVNRGIKTLVKLMPDGLALRLASRQSHRWRQAR